MTRQRKSASSPDSEYKLLFSNPIMVRDLLIGYAPGNWRENADFSTLIHVNGSYVSESGKQRHDDVVWRKWGSPHFRHYGKCFKMVSGNS